MWNCCSLVNVYFRTSQIDLLKTKANKSIRRNVTGKFLYMLHGSVLYKAAGLIPKQAVIQEL